MPLPMAAIGMSAMMGGGGAAAGGSMLMPMLMAGSAGLSAYSMFSSEGNAPPIIDKQIPMTPAAEKLKKQLYGVWDKKRRRVEAGKLDDNMARPIIRQMTIMAQQSEKEGKMASRARSAVVSNARGKGNRKSGVMSGRHAVTDMMAAADVAVGKAAPEVWKAQQRRADYMGMLKDQSNIRKIEAKSATIGAQSEMSQMLSKAYENAQFGQSVGNLAQMAGMTGYMMNREGFLGGNKPSGQMPQMGTISPQAGATLAKY